MTRDLWINLPVKDVRKSKRFYADIGFVPNPRFADGDDKASLFVGDKPVVLMLFPDAAFKSFTGNDIPDLRQTTQALFSIDADSKEEVDKLLAKVAEAGGSVYGKPSDRDWMYGAGFADPDGHRWNVLYMDTSRMPAQ